MLSWLVVLLVMLTTTGSINMNAAPATHTNC